MGKVNLNSSMIGASPEIENERESPVEEIFIGNPEQVKGWAFVPFSSHRVFPIRVNWKDFSHTKSTTEVKRRFNHFIYLHEALEKKVPFSAVPLLPDSSSWEKLSADDSEFI